MSPTLVDLRPDRQLLDHNFEGYKLNLQSLPHHSYDLESRVERLYPDEEQCSYPHAELFLLHNHLVLDFWDYSFNYYYIDNNRIVRHISFESTSNTFHSRVVYDVPITVEQKSGHFNPCLSFPSSQLAVISDGTGYLHILNTGPRNRSVCSPTWEAVNTYLVLGDDKYFEIVDSRLQEKSDTLVLHCLLKSIEHNYVHYKTVLSWIAYSYKDGAWIQTSLKKMEGKGILHYAALETKCGALYIASDNGFELTEDSEKPELLQDIDGGYVPRKLLYTWHQAFGDLCITLKLEPNFNRELFQCQVGRRTLKVSYAGRDIINSRLLHKVDHELTTWRILEDGQVDILITKSLDNNWEDLLEFMDENGEEIMDPEMMEEFHGRLAHLCSEEEVTADHPLPCLPTQQVEECDAPSDEDTVLGMYINELTCSNELLIK